MDRGCALLATAREFQADCTRAPATAKPGRRKPTQHDEQQDIQTPIAQAILK